jgi:solute carrier family 35 protein E3
MRDQAYEDVEMAKEKAIKGEPPSQDALTAKRASGKQVIDAGCILLNILTTVTLLFLSRIFKDPQLKRMQISLACYHFTCTTVVLWIASRRPFNLFVPVRLPFMQMIPLCSFFAGGIILGNLSLTFNSVGFYQSVHRRQE